MRSFMKMIQQNAFTSSSFDPPSIVSSESAKIRVTKWTKFRLKIKIEDNKLQKVQKATPSMANSSNLLPERHFANTAGECQSKRRLSAWSSASVPRPGPAWWCSRGIPPPAWQWTCSAPKSSRPGLPGKRCPASCYSASSGYPSTTANQPSISNREKDSNSSRKTQKPQQTTLYWKEMYTNYAILKMKCIQISNWKVCTQIQVKVLKTKCWKCT